MSKNKAAFKGLPKSVKIGHRTYTIHTRTEENDLKLRHDLAYTMMTYDNIVLRENLSIGQARSTLVHELLHAIDAVYGGRWATLNADEKDNDDDQVGGTKDQWEHFFINLYQDPLVSLLRDNPKLVAFLTD